MTRRNRYKSRKNGSRGIECVLGGENLHREEYSDGADLFSAEEGEGGNVDVGLLPMNTGELAAYILADALLPPDMPHVTITDSMSVRGPLISSRDAETPAPARVQIRHTFPKLGKALMSKADAIIHRRQKAQKHRFPHTAKRVKEFTDAANRRWKRHPKCKDD